MNKLQHINSVILDVYLSIDYTVPDPVELLDALEVKWFKCSESMYHPFSDVIYLKPNYIQNHTYHEIAHWTGHWDRLDRSLSSGTQKVYAREELIAEIVSTAFQLERGTKSIKKSQSYIYAWSLHERLIPRSVKEESLKVIKYIGLKLKKREKMLSKVIVIKSS